MKSMLRASLFVVSETYQEAYRAQIPDRVAGQHLFQVGNDCPPLRGRSSCHRIGFVFIRPENLRLSQQIQCEEQSPHCEDAVSLTFRLDRALFALPWKHRAARSTAS